LRLQHDYVPDGWLGILVGTRLYFDVYTEQLLENQIPRLVKELRNRGKISPSEDISEHGKIILCFCLTYESKMFIKKNICGVNAKVSKCFRIIKKIEP